MIQLFIETILKTQQSYRQVIQRKLRENGLNMTVGMFSIMKHLAKQSMNQQELTALVYRDKSSLSYLIKSMEKRGLVERIEDPRDKRSKLVILTPSGLALYKEAFRVVNNVFDEMSHEADLSHVKLCINYLKEFTDRITQN